MRRFGPHTIAVLRAPFKPDAYGNDTADRDWANAARTNYDGVSVQGQPSSEFTQDRDAVVIRKEVYGPPTLDLLATDRVEFDGAVYDVDGEPQREAHGTYTDHTYALLRRSEDT